MADLDKSFYMNIYDDYNFCEINESYFSGIRSMSDLKKRINIARKKGIKRSTIISLLIGAGLPIAFINHAMNEIEKEHIYMANHPEIYGEYDNSIHDDSKNVTNDSTYTFDNSISSDNNIANTDYLNNCPPAKSFSNMSDNGKAFLFDKEGYRSTIYDALNPSHKFTKTDTRNTGDWTIGNGHKMTDKQLEYYKNNNYSLSEFEAYVLFNEEVNSFGRAFANCVDTVLPEQIKKAKLYSQGFIDACISISFNTGSDRFANSQFLNFWSTECEFANGAIEKYKDLLERIPDMFVTASGKRLPGLEKRRAEEFDFAYNNNYPERIASSLSKINHFSSYSKADYDKAVEKLKTYKLLK